MAELNINKSTGWLTVSYEVGEGFYVDIVNLRNGHYEAWLYHGRIGYKAYLFGAKEDRADFIELVNANLSQNISLYRETYMTF